MTLLKSKMKSWGKRKLKVQRGTNLSLYIAIMSYIDPSCVLLPNVFQEVCATFWKGYTMLLLKSIMKFWEKCKVKVEWGPNLPL